MCGHIRLRIRLFSKRRINAMLNKIKTYIAHLLVLLSPSNYVDIINNAFSPEELDEELRRRTFNDRS